MVNLPNVQHFDVPAASFLFVRTSCERDDDSSHIARVGGDPSPAVLALEDPGDRRQHPGVSLYDSRTAKFGFRERSLPRASLVAHQLPVRASLHHAAEPQRPIRDWQENMSLDVQLSSRALAAGLGHPHDHGGPPLLLPDARRWRYRRPRLADRRAEKVCN